MVVISTEGDQRYYNKAQAEAQKKKRRKSQQVAAVQSHNVPATRPGMYAPPGQVDTAPAIAMPMPDPTEQLKMITSTYYELHRVWPDSDLAAMLLINFPMGRSKDDYRALLAPGLMPGENPMAPTGPGGVSELDLMAQGNRPTFIAPRGQAHPVESLVGGVPTWSEVDRSGFMGLMRAVPRPTPLMPATIKQNMDSLRRIGLALRDTGLTPYEIAEQELLLRDVKPWIEQLVLDRAELGLATEIDPDNPSPSELTGLYLEQVIGKSKADYYYGENPEAKARALETMDAAVDAAGIPNAAEVKASFRSLNDMANDLDIDKNLIAEIYYSYTMGRGVGQSKSAALWEFIDQYGRDKLPEEARVQAEQESTTIWDLMDKTMGNVFRGAGAGVGGLVRGIGEYANPIDLVTEEVADHVPGKLGELASIAHDLDEKFVEGVAWVGEKGAEGAIPMLAFTYFNRAGATLSDFIFNSGIFDPSEYDGLSMMETNEKLADTLTSARAWKDAWKNGEGKFVVAKVAEDFCETVGLPADNPAITFLAGIGDLWLSVKVGTKLDAAFRFGAVRAYRGSFAVARSSYSTVQGLRNRPPGGFLKPVGERGAVNLDMTGAGAISKAVRGIIAWNKKKGQGGFFNLRSERVQKARANMPEDVRAKWDATNEKIEALEREVAEAYEGDLTGGMAQSKDILARVRELGIDDLAPDSLAKKFGMGMNATERSRAFKGTLVNKRNLKKRGPGRSMDDAAKTIGEEFPGSGITDAEGLYDFLSNYEPTKKVTGKRAANKTMKELEGYVDENVRVLEQYEKAGGRVGPIETDAAGNSVRKVTLKDGTTFYADATLAEAAANLNEAGFKTKGSHSAYAEEHAKGSAAIKEGAPPYWEFEVEGLGKKRLAAIRDLDGNIGLKVIEENGLIRIEGKQLGDITYAADVLTGRAEKYVHKGAPVRSDMEYAEQYVNEGPEAGNPELTPGDLRGTGVRPPEGPPPEQLTVPIPDDAIPPDVYERFPKMLQTIAEVVAESMPEEIGGVRSEAAIRQVLNIPDVDELRPALTALGKAKTPEAVARVMYKYDLEIDPSLPGVFASRRFRAVTGQTSPSALTRALKIAGTPIALESEMPLRNADRHIANLARTYKMGFRDASDPAIPRRVNFWRQEMWAARRDSSKMQQVLDDFYKEVFDNMGDDLQVYQRFESNILRARGRYFGAAGHGRGYAERDIVVRAGYRPGLSAKLKYDVEQLAVKAQNAGESRANLNALQDGIVKTKALIDRYDQAARVMRKGKAEKGMTLEDAQRYMRSIGNHQPLYEFQLRKNLMHQTEPVLLTMFMAGNRTAKLSRSLIIAEAYSLAKLSSALKLIALSSISFPIRAIAGDELIRTIPEGIGPKRLLASRETVRGIKEDGRWGPEITRELYDVENSDLLRDFSDDFMVIAPEDLGSVPGGWKAMADYMSQYEKEPIFRMWKELGDSRPKDAAGIREFVEQAIMEQSPNGARLRTIIVRNTVVTKGQAEGTRLARLLSHPEATTGVAANLNQYVSEVAGQLHKVATDQKLWEVMRDRRFTQGAIENLDPKSLWPVPVRRGRMMERMGGLWNPINLTHAFYEHATVPLLSAMTNRLREVFFGDAYRRERAILEGKGMTDPAEMHQIAKDRAIDYVNRVTYTRQSSVLEYALRNHIWFLNSYRQFAWYWMKTYARNPVAMTAAYQLHPQRGQMGETLGDWTGFLAPSPFWVPQTAEDEGKVGMARNLLPNVGPVDAMFAQWFSSNVLGIEGDISQSPFLGTASTSWSPLSKWSRIIMGLTGKDIGVLGVDPGKVKREHLDIVKAITRDESVQLDGEEPEQEWNWALGWMHKLGAPYPEQLAQGFLSYVSPISAKYTPEEARVVNEAKRNYRTMNPLMLAQYRSENPKADELYTFWETKDPEEKERYIYKHPWLLDQNVSSYNQKRDGSWIPTIGDWIEQVENGSITIRDEKEWLTERAKRQVTIFGGLRGDTKGNWEPFAGNVAANEADKYLQQYIKTVAKPWAKKTSLKIAKGNRELAQQFYDRWEQGLEDGDTRMPSMFETEAVKQGLNPADYDPMSLVGEFEAKYGENPRYHNNGMSDTTAKAVATLVQSGVMGPQFKLAAESLSPFSPDVKAARDKLVVDRRRALFDPLSEEFYKLDGRAIAKMGRLPDKYIPGLDRAIVDVQNYYYHTYQPVKDKYGAQTREGRDAKLAFDKYRDKRFGQVKGGAMLVGGFPQRILSTPYFNRPALITVGAGKHSVKQEHLWTRYVAEAYKERPDIELLRKMYEGFGKTNRTNWQEISRVNKMVYTAGMASYYRAIMKTSWSEYYQGPGNSNLTKMGKRMVADLRSLMKELIEEDGGAKTSLYAQDIEAYFGGTHSFASALLDWYYR